LRAFGKIGDLQLDFRERQTVASRITGTTSPRGLPTAMPIS